MPSPTDRGEISESGTVEPQERYRQMIEQLHGGRAEYQELRRAFADVVIDFLGWLKEEIGAPVLLPLHLADQVPRLQADHDVVDALSLIHPADPFDGMRFRLGFFVEGSRKFPEPYLLTVPMRLDLEGLSEVEADPEPGKNRGGKTVDPRQRAAPNQTQEPPVFRRLSPRIGTLRMRLGWLEYLVPFAYVQSHDAEPETGFAAQLQKDLKQLEDDLEKDRRCWRKNNVCPAKEVSKKKKDWKQRCELAITARTNAAARIDEMLKLLPAYGYHWRSFYNRLAAIRDALCGDVQYTQELQKRFEKVKEPPENQPVPNALYPIAGEPPCPDEANTILSGIDKLKRVLILIALANVLRAVPAAVSVEALAERMRGVLMHLPAVAISDNEYANELKNELGKAVAHVPCDVLVEAFDRAPNAVIELKQKLPEALVDALQDAPTASVEELANRTRAVFMHLPVATIIDHNFAEALKKKLKDAGMQAATLAFVDSLRSYGTVWSINPKILSHNPVLTSQINPPEKDPMQAFATAVYVMVRNFLRFRAAGVDGESDAMYFRGPSPLGVAVAAVRQALQGPEVPDAAALKRLLGPSIEELKRLGYDHASVRPHLSRLGRWALDGHENQHERTHLSPQEVLKELAIAAELLDIRWLHVCTEV